MVDDDFGKMIEQLQKKIEDDEEKTYSKVVINEYRNPIYFGSIENPDSIGQIKGPCKDTMRFTLRVKDNVVQDARFWTDGCGATIAAGNMLIKTIIGKTLDEANSVTYEQLIDSLDGLPEEHLHCALLAVKTLQNSIENYHKNR